MQLKGDVRMKNRIAELRKERGLTLKQLGTSLEIRDNTLSQYETGKRQPRDKETWNKIAEYFGVSVAYVMGVSDFPSMITFEEMLEMLINSKDELQKIITKQVNEIIDLCLYDNDDDNRFYFFDIYTCNYAYKLLERLIYSQNIDFQIENEFEQYRYSKKKIIEEISHSILNEMIAKDSSQSLLFTKELNLINGNKDYYLDSLNFIILIIEELSKHYPQLLAFMLKNKIGNCSDEINSFLKNKNYSGIGVMRNYAYLDKEAIIDEIDYKVYVTIQEKLSELTQFIDNSLTS